MHLGILTGGGDVPGLNPAIKTVVNEAAQRGWRVTGFRRGWAGPLNYNPADPKGSEAFIMPLSVTDVHAIDRSGGTILHTSRTQPSKMRPDDLPAFLQTAENSRTANVDCTDHVLSVFESLEIDVLVAIGGDDTLSYAARIHGEGMPTICIPKTMDNDVYGTEYCIGYSTCVTRSVELIDRLRTPVGSHERFLVVELFGRNCGQTALMAGYLAGADRTLIAEVPFDLNRVTELLTDDRRANPSNYAVAVVSEGAQVSGQDVFESGDPDAYGHRKLGGIGYAVGEHLKQATGVGVMVQSLAYLLRAGAPDAVDQLVPRNYATMAVRCIEEGRTGLMMAVQDGHYTTAPADISTRGKRRVDVANMYDPDSYTPRIAALEGMPMFGR
ncbi:MAG: phosphofructokinase [Rhodospirillaceae bacterium]|jgi:6-phosphofructokinase 1|nr:phosphofructokinase [Rhodospirillaceae bacterium]MBT3810336.1 phosphofructokinase [Rhodospirillaceae bacterium]MBT3932284.1 phosphofructokinase [Rhodospirillaceae bacterium]MBT4772142.1 phosphofructokinase [Rhodospirillaceae bacterium]MBT5359429.1 phosphofructokinase [Rhodospirillaceae bacterium]